MQDHLLCDWYQALTRWNKCTRGQTDEQSDHLCFFSLHFYYPVVKLPPYQCQPHIPVHSLDLASEEFQRRWQGKISSAFQQEHKRTSLMRCLGIHVCFLCLTCIQTQLFWQPHRAAGANTRWGGGTKCYRKYGCAAQSTTWTEAFGRWTMTFLKDFE